MTVDMWGATTMIETIGVLMAGMAHVVSRRVPPSIDPERAEAERMAWDDIHDIEQRVGMDVCD